MERGSSENRGAGGPAARRRPAPVGFGHASFYRRKPRHYTMAHNRSPLSRSSAEFWNQIAGHMLSAHRRGMQKTRGIRSEEHTSELQSLMRISYAVFCLKKKNYLNTLYTEHTLEHISLIRI